MKLSRMNLDEGDRADYSELRTSAQKTNAPYVIGASGTLYLTSSILIQLYRLSGDIEERNSRFASTTCEVLGPGHTN